MGKAAVKIIQALKSQLSSVGLIVVVVPLPERQQRIALSRRRRAARRLKESGSEPAPECRSAFEPLSPHELQWREACLPLDPRLSEPAGIACLPVPLLRKQKK